MAFYKGALLALGVCQHGSSATYLKDVSKYVDSINPELWPINKEIHDNPELQYEEVKAHKILTDFMADQDGWKVTRSAYNISTAFVAVYEGDGDGDGPVVSFNAEYDALVDLGHACGHNLIAMASVSGALATAEIMRKEKLGGKVVLFGTPAEEGGGGKVKLLDAGAYDDYKVDVSLISHPGNGGDTAWMTTTAITRFEIEYTGKEAHAAASPWEGINAQDAIVLAYDGPAMLRQQTRRDEIIQGYIKSGGSRYNVISAKSSGLWALRANNVDALSDLTERVHQCFKGAAVATGTKLNFTKLPYGYTEMRTNDILARSYSTWFAKLGGKPMEEEKAKAVRGSASTDQGNISHEFPSISAGFEIHYDNGTSPATGPHTPEFEIVAGTRRAFNESLAVGKSLAGVALDVLTVDGYLDKVKENFKKTGKSSPDS
ncbi:Peptidase M20 domain-containing protein 2 [Fusarium falciforme]|uniref:Peptidase M20 domain-containing protein 2 n=1 Tax=Fusarium falciforme TaxID=195108 RepID=UPI00230028A3|nr:Peptidase M20 domain-containing protein 2 [Fusarium falciforme]WAO86207.1 Peptidase M20 domain-containing protein 2 [Fusarium falciforme]